MNATFVLVAGARGQKRQAAEQASNSEPTFGFLEHPSQTQTAWAISDLWSSVYPSVSHVIKSLIQRLLGRLSKLLLLSVTQTLVFHGTWDKGHGTRGGGVWVGVKMESTEKKKSCRPTQEPTVRE